MTLVRRGSRAPDTKPPRAPEKKAPASEPKPAPKAADGFREGLAAPAPDEKHVPIPSGALGFEDAAVADAERKSPRTLALEVEKALSKARTPAQVQRVIEESSPALQVIARQAMEGGDPEHADSAVVAALTTLSRAVEALGPESAVALAEAFASGFPKESSKKFHQAMHDAVHACAGATFAVEVGAALLRQGNTKAARDSFEGVSDALRSQRTLFKKEADRALTLNRELGRLVSGFGSALSEAKVDAGIRAFKARHKDEFKALEEAGTKLATMLGGSAAALHHEVDLEGDRKGREVVDESVAILMELDRIGLTEGGTHELAKALKAQSRDEPNFVDRVLAAGKKVKKTQGKLKQVSQVLVQAAGLTALELARQGRLKEADLILGTLVSNAALFGASESRMEAVSDSLRDALRGKRGAMEDLEKSVSGAKGGTPGAPVHGPVADALMGLGLALCAADVINGWTNFEDDSLSKQLRTVGRTASLGNQSGKFALEMMGRSSASGAVGTGMLAASRLSAGFGALANAVAAGASFRQGDIEGGVFSSLPAIGGVMMLVPGGQGFGAILSIGGSATHFVVNQVQSKMEELRDQEDAHAFLTAAGVKDDVAKRLHNMDSKYRNIGEALGGLGKALGVEPAGLLAHWNSLPDDKMGELGDLVDKSLDALQKLDRKRLPWNRDESKTAREREVFGEVAAWAHAKGLSPASSPR